MENEKTYEKKEVIEQENQKDKTNIKDQFISKVIAAEVVYNEVFKARIISLLSIISCFLITLASRASKYFSLLITAIFCAVFVFFTWRSTNELVRLNDTYNLGKTPIPKQKKDE